MSGDERVRFCRQCRQRVYNLSEMTRAEAEAVLQPLYSPTVSLGNHAAEQHVCVRFYRRPDGTVVTRDCFALRRALRKGVRAMFAATAGVVLVLLGCLGFAPKTDGSAISAWTKLCEMEPLRILFGGRRYQVMGAVCLPIQGKPGPMGNGAPRPESPTDGIGD